MSLHTIDLHKGKKKMLLGKEAKGGQSYKARGPLSLGGPGPSPRTLWAQTAKAVVRLTICAQQPENLAATPHHHHTTTAFSVAWGACGQSYFSLIIRMWLSCQSLYLFLFSGPVRAGFVAVPLLATCICTTFIQWLWYCLVDG